jgi:hypothetical protein
MNERYFNTVIRSRNISLENIKYKRQAMKVCGGVEV